MVKRVSRKNPVDEARELYEKALAGIHIDIGSHNTKPRAKNPAPKKFKVDKRYSIGREYTGHISGKPRYVLRFMGDYVGDFATKAEAGNAMVEYDLKRFNNPAPRIGTARPKRVSQVTKKAPTKRLVSRRRVNSEPGYYPNPNVPEVKYVVIQRSPKGDEPICYTTNNRYSMAIANLLQERAAPGVTFFDLKV